MFIRPAFIITAALLALLTGSSRAVDIERYMPKTISDNPATATPPKQAEDKKGTAADMTPVIKKLKAIVLLSKPDHVRKDAPPSVTGVSTPDKDLPVPGIVRSGLEGYIGKEVSLATLQDITRAMVTRYRLADYPVVDVAIPEQSIEEGVLQLIVVLGHVGKVRVEGNKYFSADTYTGAISFEQGDIIRSGPISSDLRFLNRHPFRRVDMVYTPGSGFGETDLILDAAELRPWSFYVGYENTGTPLLDENRLLFGGEWGNVFGWGHQLAYQYTTSPSFDKIQAHVLSYRIPLPKWHQELQFVLGYVNSDVNIPTSEQDEKTLLHIGGESYQASLIDVIQLPSIAGWAQDLIVGFDYKNSDNFLEFGGESVFDTNTELYQFSIGHALEKHWLLGNTRLTNTFYYGFGDEETFKQARAGAKGNYFYWRGDLRHVAFLPKDFRLSVRVTGQVANSNLLPSEALLLGGVDSIRGYDQNLLRVDSGMIASMELYTPAVSILGPLSRMCGLSKTASAAPASGGKGAPTPARTESKGDELRAFSFLDYGFGASVDKLPDEKDISLASVGVGLEYHVRSNITLRGSYGWQIHEEGFDDKKNGRFHLSAVIRY